ncbi:hypothetical protein NPIL_492791 [Nephila pilipes]|uniref:Uncharacterized protein n=1 Tax=Nephila pilipes TaxID=299642 RepID=A0A8X6NDA9_NEPPI|nr:hypothetical protein NPIL_492791 [Nephila pilipes]
MHRQRGTPKPSRRQLVLPATMQARRFIRSAHFRGFWVRDFFFLSLSRELGVESEKVFSRRRPSGGRQSSGGAPLATPPEDSRLAILPKNRYFEMY